VHRDCPRTHEHNSILKETCFMLTRTLVFVTALVIGPAAFAAADLTTSISVSPGTAQVYSTARYTVTVSNIGNKSASNATVRITLPATHTSPQVYVLGSVGALSAGCSRTGVTINCTLGSIARNASRSVFFDVALPVSSAPFVFTATAATPSAENSTANNGASRTASQSFYATTVDATPGVPVRMLNSHCAGTGLTAWYECTLFPSSISAHEADFHDDGSITFPTEPGFGGTWTVTVTPSGNQLAFTIDEIGYGPVATFTSWGADADCFEGLTTFPGSSYVSPYEVCPL